MRKIDKARPEAAAVDPETPPGAGLGVGLPRTLSAEEPSGAAVEAGPAARPSREAVAVAASPNGRMKRKLGGREAPAYPESH